MRRADRRAGQMVEKAGSKFETSDVLRMFPTWVWKAELKAEAHQPIDRRIVESLREIRGEAPELAPGQFWQSDQDLHKRPEFADLMSCVGEAAERALEFLRIGDRDIEITACWANINARATGHGIHSHPNNFLSGIYYAATHEGAETVNFHDPRLQAGIIRPPVTELTAENTDQVVVKVKNGTLLLFPSWLQHSVDPSRSDQHRVSVSFNLMFSSYTEKMSKPLW